MQRNCIFAPAKNLLIVKNFNYKKTDFSLIEEYEKKQTH